MTKSKWNRRETLLAGAGFGELRDAKTRQRMIELIKSI